MMLFTSLEFLFFFLPAILLGYFLAPERFKNIILLLASLFFYGWGEPGFVFVMLAVVFVNYCTALLISKTHNKTKRKLFLSIAVLSNIGILFVYKYMNFITSVVRDLIPWTQNWVVQTEFVLPIGISFFIFQALSYVIDVYRGIPAQKNFFHLCLYISFFPQLIAGPIVRYTTIKDQIEHRKITSESFYEGIVRFLRGFNKKVLLANVLSVCAEFAFSCEELSVVMAWIGIVCYSLQIYFDFSGYSEMAIGLGRMFGFVFEENFNYPYISSSVTEFWRRWHMSLGTWFKDYVYFPLGGSHCTKGRLVFNLMVTWMATGIWHGASWNFILWGLLYGVLITIEKLLNIVKVLNGHKTVKYCYQLLTLLMVMCGWVLFRAETLPSAFNYLKTMFLVTESLFLDAQAIFHLKEYGLVILIGIVCCTPLLKQVVCRLCSVSEVMNETIQLFSFLVQFILFLVSVSYLVISAHNPFIYFNF